MLGRRHPDPDASPSYAVLWANLRKRFPGLRTVLVTGASSGDDAATAAIGLAKAATGDGSSALLLVLESATQSHRDAPAPAVQMIAALSLERVRAILAEAGQQFPLVVVVAPPPQRDSESVAAGGLADAAVLVAREGRTRFADAQMAADLLRQAGIATAAAILLTRRTLRRATAVDRPAADPGQIAELRPHPQLKERREASAGLDLLS